MKMQAVTAAAPPVVSQFCRRRLAQQKCRRGRQQQRQPAQNPPFVLRQRIGRVDGHADAAAGLIARRCLAALSACRPLSALRILILARNEPVPETVNSIALPGRRVPHQERLHGRILRRRLEARPLPP
jgi:hypothetical protein